MAKRDRTEFGVLLDELIAETGKKDFEVAREMGWSAAHLSRTKLGKANLSERYISDLTDYFVGRKVGGIYLEQRLHETASVSQYSIERMHAKNKPSDRRLNIYKQEIEEPSMKLKVELTVPKRQISSIKLLLSKLENISDELLKKIMALFT
jgi:hypothetical protein